MPYYIWTESLVSYDTESTHNHNDTFANNNSVVGNKCKNNQKQWNHMATTTRRSTLLCTSTVPLYVYRKPECCSVATFSVLESIIKFINFSVNFVLTSIINLLLIFVVNICCAIVNDLLLFTTCYILLFFFLYGTVMYRNSTAGRSKKYLTLCK